MTRLRFLAVLCVIGIAGPAVAAGDSQRIHAAAAAGDTHIVTALLEQSPQLLEARDQSGATPLLVAAGHLQATVAESLIEAGADVNARDRDGATSLQRAIAAGTDSPSEQAPRLAFVKLLLDRGADVNLADQQGLTPVHVAAAKGRIEILASLAKAGASLTVQDQHGRTALHTAAMSNQVDVIEWLVEQDADVAKKDKVGETPLHVAARRFRGDAVESLLALGAAVDARNANGATPLHLTAVAGPEELEVDRLMARVADVLLRQGADVNAVDKDGHTTLYYARARNRTALAEILHSHGGSEESAVEQAVPSP